MKPASKSSIRNVDWYLGRITVGLVGIQSNNYLVKYALKAHLCTRIRRTNNTHPLSRFSMVVFCLMYAQGQRHDVAYLHELLPGGRRPAGVRVRLYLLHAGRSQLRSGGGRVRARPFRGELCILRLIYLGPVRYHCYRFLWVSFSRGGMFMGDQR